MPLSNFRAIHLPALIVAGLISGCAVSEGDRPAASFPTTFSFYAMGDTAYDGLASYGQYSSLVDEINQAAPPFTIHIGDTGGSTACDVDYHDGVKAFFDTFEQPLIYTPGDNEWTDCAGVAFERLHQLRQVFFSTAYSQGKNPMPLQQQPPLKGEIGLPENATWVYGGVHFATVHVTGSNNHWTDALGQPGMPWAARNQANRIWIQHIIDKAISDNAPAVVLALHAELFIWEPNNGFNQIIDTLEAEAVKFGKPILLIDGDIHDYILHRPFKAQNIVQLRPGGWPCITATRVTVDVNASGVFSAPEPECK